MIKSALRDDFYVQQAMRNSPGPGDSTEERNSEDVRFYHERVRLVSIRDNIESQLKTARRELVRLGDKEISAAHETRVEELEGVLEDTKEMLKDLVDNLIRRHSAFIFGELALNYMRGAPSRLHSDIVSIVSGKAVETAWRYNPNYNDGEGSRDGIYPYITAAGKYIRNAIINYLKTQSLPKNRNVPESLDTVLQGEHGREETRYASLADSHAHTPIDILDRDEQALRDINRIAVALFQPEFTDCERRTMTLMYGEALGKATVPEAICLLECYGGSVSNRDVPSFRDVGDATGEHYQAHQQNQARTIRKLRARLGVEDGGHLASAG